MRPDEIELLQELLRRESRSLLQYASESYPWSKSDSAAATGAVRAMAQAQTELVARLARWLDKQHVPVTFPGAYPMHYTTGNFVAMHYLVPRLVEDENRCIAAAEHTVRAISANEARELLRALIDLKKQHVQQLNALRASAAPAAVAS